MSPVAIGLDLILITLLIAALVVGLRLSKKLKVLRDGQAGFLRAVAELDSAAARAESGLKALRAASEDTHDQLLTRIETARALIARLDSLGAAAVLRASAEPAPVAAPQAATVRLAPPRPELRPEPRAEERFRPPPPRRPAARGVDDDLFEAEPALPRLRGDRR